MARDTHVLKDFESRLRDAGGAFVRVTGKGYRRWHLKNGKTVMVVDLPTKGYEFGHQKKNVEAEIKRALKACGAAVVHPRDKRAEWKEARERRERAVARAAPVQVAEPPSAPVRQDQQAEDLAGDVRAGADERGHADVGRDEPSGPAPTEQGVVGSVERGEREALPGTDERAKGYECEVCKETFAWPMNLGRHRQARHGIVGAGRAKAARVADVAPTKVAPDATPADRQSGPGWRFAPAPARPMLTGPPPLGMTRPTATLVAGTATMEKVAALADALAAAARDLVTEYRLVREENTRLTEAVQQMERMFEGLRRR